MKADLLKHGLLALFATVCCWSISALNAAEIEFTRKVIDLGVVVNDVEKAAKFYKEAIGFTELDGFSVSAEFATDAGLTNGHELNIRVMVLGNNPQATRIKLMEIPGAKPSKPVQPSGSASQPGEKTFIHTRLGFSYLTIFVADTSKALDRLKKAGVKPLAKGPIPLPGQSADGVHLTLVKDPDGNFIELIGPKAPPKPE